MNRKRKKSLVGWAEPDWKLRILKEIDCYDVIDATIIFAKKPPEEEKGKTKKVRITITDL